MSNDKEKGDKRQVQPVFIFGGSMFVPHLKKKQHWVGPGGQVKTTIELQACGAKASTAELWPVGWTKTAGFFN